MRTESLIGAAAGGAFADTTSAEALKLVRGMIRPGRRANSPMNEPGPLAHDRFGIVTADSLHYLDLFGQEDVDIRTDFTGRKGAGTSRIRSSLAKAANAVNFRGRQAPTGAGTSRRVELRPETVELAA